MGIEPVLLTHLNGRIIALLPVLQPPNSGPGRTRTSEPRRERIYSPQQLPLCDRPKMWKLNRNFHEPAKRRLTIFQVVV